MGFGTRFGIRFGIDDIQGPSGNDYLRTNVDSLSVSDIKQIVVNYFRIKSESVTTNDTLTKLSRVINIVNAENVNVVDYAYVEYFTDTEPIGIDLWYYPETADNFVFSCVEAVTVHDYVGADPEISPVNSVHYDYFKSNSFITALSAHINEYVVRANLTTIGRFYLAKSLATGMVIIPHKFNLGLSSLPFSKNYLQEANAIDQVVASGSVLGGTMRKIPSSSTTLCFCCYSNSPIFVSTIMIYAYIRNSAYSGENFLEFPFAHASFQKRMMANELIISISL